MYLAGGAALGPEAALSNVGGGMATFITEHWVHFEDDNDRKLVVLSGTLLYPFDAFILSCMKGSFVALQY